MDPAERAFHERLIRNFGGSADNQKTLMGNLLTYEVKNYDVDILKRERHSTTSNAKKKKVTAEFVTDVTLPDRTYYPLDTVLTKTWLMRNNGDHEWGSHVELVFFKGNESLSLEQRYQVVNAAPGQTAEVSAVIKTPNKPGRYCSYYRLQRNGEYFGPRVWVDIFAVDEHEPPIAIADEKSNDLLDEIGCLSYSSDHSGFDGTRKKNQDKADPFRLIMNAKCRECARVMQRVSPLEVYLRFGAVAQCDLCRISIPAYKVMYHCTNPLHAPGYDECNDCVNGWSKYRVEINRKTFDTKCMRLYHVTDMNGAIGIQKEGKIKRGKTGMFGPGIYFAETVDDAHYKALHDGYLIICNVLVGRAKTVPGYTGNQYSFTLLQKEGYDSVHAPAGSGKGNSERVVFNYDQVNVLDVIKRKLKAKPRV